MPNTIHYQQCPSCGSTNIHAVLTAKDYTVSNETFPVYECSNCTLRFTQDVPDQEHIGPYYKSEEYISHTNTSKGLINQLYQSVRKRTMNSKRKLVEKVTGLSKGALLDYGAGTGSFIHSMQEHGWQVTGIEPDSDARKAAGDLYKLSLYSIDHLQQLPASSVDAITLWHVLEHVHDLHGQIERLKAVLKPNGRLLIAVPNYTSGDAAAYKENWAAYDVPRHLYHFSPASMQTLMQQHGLVITQYLPMWYDSFYVSLLSNKNSKGSAGWFSAVWNGFSSNLKAFSDSKRCSSVIYIIKKA